MRMVRIVSHFGSGSRVTEPMRRSEAIEALLTLYPGLDISNILRTDRHDTATLNPGSERSLHFTLVSA